MWCDSVQTHGQEQAEAVQKLLVKMQETDQHTCAVFSDVAVRQDLFGVARFVTAKRCASSLES